MKPEDKHCTPEQAKRLVELGVVLDTEWLWDVNSNPLNKNIELRRKSTIHFDKNLYKDYIFPAPDVAELGELLGEHIYSDLVQIYRGYSPAGTNETCFEIFLNSGPEQYYQTEAQARCASLIWLIEKGYLKPEELKL